MRNAQREFDIVLFGATGFTGRLVAAALLKAAPASSKLALAGRSPEKLEQIQASLGPDGVRFSRLVADANDGAALAALASRTAVICTTVGPYAQYGVGLVDACAHAGTHYCDLTGEVQFMRDSIDRNDAAARQSGAKIVHACGFDSIPSDLGVLFLSEGARKTGLSGHLGETALCVERAKGNFSGGTIASLVNVLDEARANPARRKLLFDPYGLSPNRENEPDFGQQRDLAGAKFDTLLDRHTAPFVMAGINTRVVRRSNALSDFRYGRTFKYREVTGCGVGAAGYFRSVAIAGGTGALMAGLSSDLTRGMLLKMLPKPGQGPSETERINGFFKIRIATLTPEGKPLHVWVRGKGDPGYEATSRMLAQSALALAEGRTTERTGCLTPSTAFGAEFVERLNGTDIRFSFGDEA
jgi:short subunit dehydrogenase-like uncharacterized protein